MYENLKRISFCSCLAVLIFLASCGEKTAVLQIATSHGDIKIKLYNETPAHRDTFLALVKRGYYDDLLFHRVIEDFVVQGGDPKSKSATPETQLGASGKDFKIPAETNNNHINKKGALAFANVYILDSTQLTVGGQFYIVDGKKIKNGELSMIEKKFGKSYSDEQKEIYGEKGGLPHLDGRNTIFGEVVKGIEVLDKIARKPTNDFDRPLEDVKFTITILKELK